jgi:hypothetical protein
VRCAGTWQPLDAVDGHEATGRDSKATFASRPDADGGKDVCAGCTRGWGGAADCVHLEGGGRKGRDGRLARDAHARPTRGPREAHARPTRGHPAHLDGEQWQALGRALVGKPTEHGFGTELWTWAPKGKTPTIQFHFNWTHILVIAGLSRTQCMFRLHEGSIRKEQHVQILKALRAHFKQRLLIIWDGLKAHRGGLVRDYLDSTDGDIRMAFLPPLVARLESGGIPVGAADASCAGQLLPGQLG